MFTMKWVVESFAKRRKGIYADMKTVSFGILDKEGRNGQANRLMSKNVYLA